MLPRDIFKSHNPQSDELNNLNFHPLEVVSRYLDPQLQARENYVYLLSEAGRKWSFKMLN